MKFTRDPLRESLIMADSGKKLLISNRFSKDEFFKVDVIELISLGKSHFFRSCSSDEDFIIPIDFCDIKEVVSSDYVNDKFGKVNFNRNKKTRRFVKHNNKLNTATPVAIDNLIDSQGSVVSNNID